MHRDFCQTALQLERVSVTTESVITHLVGKAKLSQCKELRDIRNVGEVLAAQGDLGVGQAMLAAAARQAEQG